MTDNAPSWLHWLGIVGTALLSWVQPLAGLVAIVWGSLQIYGWIINRGWRRKEKLMKFVLLFLVLSANGPETGAFKFDTLAECNARLAQMPAQIAKYNDQADEDAQIQLYGAACTEIKPVVLKGNP